MPGITNKGKYRILYSYYRSGNPAWLALLADTTAPGADTDTMAGVTEVPAGNGYVSGGQSVTLNATDVDVITEDDVNDRALIQLKDFAWTAAGGNLPATGNGAHYAVLTDNNVTVSLREIINYWDLQANRIVSNGQTVTLQNCEFRIND